MSYSSNIESVYGKQGTDPDYVYYNADIINNNTQNTINGISVVDPQIRFNETRDAPIIKNAKDYLFSIIRFTMNGPNKDLPILIPDIQDGTGQQNVNLTTYSMAVGVQQDFVGGSGGVTPFTAFGLPVPRYMQYVPETQNNVIAPSPKSMANSLFIGQYVNTRAYQPNQIVSLIAPDPRYNSWLSGPFYKPITPSLWNQSNLYRPGNAVLFQNQFYFTTANVPANSPAPTSGAPWVLGTPINTSPFYSTPDISPYWSSVDNAQGQPQDLSTRYYWVNTFQHWIDLWNITMYNPADASLTPGNLGTCCYMDTYNAFYTNFTANPAAATYTFPYATLGDFVKSCYPPQMIFDASTFKFKLLCDSDGFGQRITAFTPSVPPAVSPIISVLSPLQMRLFFNGNMTGLFGNYCNTFWNNPGTISPSPYPGQNVPDGYVIEILTVNKNYSNILDYSVAPYTTYVPTNQQKIYWLNEQDYVSVDSFWSPISSIVFTSSLLPIQNELTGAPVTLGTSNTGYSSVTVQNAFQPIITDISLDTSQAPYCAQYRQYTSYVPAAEYRLSSFTSSDVDIRNIDVQVYWKNRLDSQLYPIYMPNLSSVSIKIMFRHKDTTFAPKDSIPIY